MVLKCAGCVKFKPVQKGRVKEVTRGGRKKLKENKKMKDRTKIEDQERKIRLINKRIKNRKFQMESIYKCLPGKIETHQKIRNANDKTWDVILFIALNNYSAKPITSSEVYLGAGLPKRTVIRILEKLENLNVIERTTDLKNGRVTRVEFSDCFAREIDGHLEDCISEGI